jgi:predicted 3-demethylubiquinone-9 3-methyltransferase (glyoxalase superfamily)
MPAITPCLWFDGRAEEAARFYCSVFPGSRITHVQRYGPNEHGEEGAVMVVAFELDGKPFTALNGGPQFTFSEAVSFQIDCADQADVDHYWDALTDGGEEGQCGWLKDRFGVSWQTVPRRLIELMAQDAETAVRVTQAFLPMKRLDIAVIEKAAAG